MSDVPRDHSAFYAALTARQRGLLSAVEQDTLKTTRFVIAGCGSTGGACVMPLVRSGAERLVLLDPGRYELSNLNRQDATLGDLGVNKARSTAARARAVNPFVAVAVHEEGVDPATIASILRDGDVVIDAVDVTGTPGLRAKVALHVAACERRLPVVTAYDIATTQYLELFDYRKLRRPLGGRIDEPLEPDRVLRALIPPSAIPLEIFPELVERRRDPGRGFPQLAMTATLLGALIVPYLLRLLTERPVRTRVRVDLHDLLRPAAVKIGARLRRDVGLVGLWWRLRG